jgi:hypothetical protein
MAKAKAKDPMVTRSIYIRESLYLQLRKASQRVGASIVIEYLVRMWLDGEISIPIQPDIDKARNEMGE